MDSGFFHGFQFETLYHLDQEISGDIRRFCDSNCTCWFHCWSLLVSSSLNDAGHVRTVRTALLHLLTTNLHDSLRSMIKSSTGNYGN